MSLTFSPENHEYRLDGRVLPYVTGVLAATGIMCVDPRVPRARLELARDRGAKAHLAIRFSVEGRLDAASVDDVISPLLWAFEAFCANHAGDFEPLIVEEPMVEPTMLFAGTPDLIGNHKGRLAIVEVKTGAEMPPGAAIQTAAQKLLAKANGHSVTERYGLHLRPDGSYKLHEFRDPNDEQEFRCALYVVQRRLARGERIP